MAKNIFNSRRCGFHADDDQGYLNKNGYTIAAEAENGKIAVDKYNETKPDLVLMDITMPEMDGIQALKAIKEMTQTPLSSCALRWTAGNGNRGQSSRARRILS